MFPYDIPTLTHEELRKYKGFENMTDDELDKALDVLYTLTYAYLSSKEKIEEYERKKTKNVMGEEKNLVLIYKKGILSMLPNEIIDGGSRI